jgi:26S proteasome regulatory subunit T1
MTDKKDEKQIDSSSKKQDDKKAAEKKKDSDNMKDDNGRPLTDADIALIKRYGKGPYFDPLKKVEEDIKVYNTKISTLCGIKESDTGLALPASWNLQADAMMMKQEPTL